MSRKDWSEQRRHEEVYKLSDRIEASERKRIHLLSPNWRDPLPRMEEE